MTRGISTLSRVRVVAACALSMSSFSRLFTSFPRSLIHYAGFIALFLLLPHLRGNDSELADVHNEKLLKALRDLPAAMSGFSISSEKSADESQRQRAYPDLEKEHELPAGSLALDLPGFLDRLLIRMDTSSLDRAYALYVKKDFSKAEAEALDAKKWALDAPTPQIDAAIAALQFAGRSARAQFQYERAVEHARAATALPNHDDDPATWANAQWGLAEVMDYLGLYSESEPIWRQALVEYILAYGEDDDQVLSIRSALAHGLEVQQRAGEAGEQYREILAIRLRVLGPGNPETLRSRTDLADNFCFQGRYTEAEREHRAVLAISMRTLGPDHLDVLTSRESLARVLRSQGKYREAEAEHRAVLELRTKLLGSDHRLTLWTAYNLALDLYKQFDLPEARKYAQLAYEEGKRTLGADERYVQTYKGLCDELNPAERTNKKIGEWLFYAK